MLQFFPALDLMGGQVVRLRQGRAEEKTVYDDDPVAVARRWEAAGGHWLHLVDLDAAFSGRAQNLEVVRRIAAAVAVPCQLGGGLREEAQVEAALAAGVRRVVIGTRAAESAGFVAGLVARFGPDRVVVGIDAKDGIVAVRGWTASSGRPALEVAREAQAAGAAAIVYTDVATDGMMQGPNYAALDELLGQITCPLIASGGVASTADLVRLAGRPRLHGAIVGRALYEGTVDLAEARRQLAPGP